MPEIFCPILLVSDRAEKHCMQDNCGFWSQGLKSCSIRAIAETLKDIGRSTDDVASELRDIDITLDTK